MAEMDEGEVRITSETQRFVEVFVNGRSMGKKAMNGSPSIKELATQFAQEHGIRSFTVTLDDEPVTNEHAHDPVPEGARFGVQAKDARGGKRKKAGAPEAKPEPTIPEASETTEEEEKVYEEVEADAPPEAA